MQSHGGYFSTHLLNPCHQARGVMESARHWDQPLRKPQMVVGLAWPLEFLPQTPRCCCHCCCHCLSPHFHCRIPHTCCQSLCGWSPHLLIHLHFTSHCCQSPCWQSPHLPDVLTCYPQWSWIHPRFPHQNRCATLWLWSMSRHCFKNSHRIHLTQEASRRSWTLSGLECQMVNAVGYYPLMSHMSMPGMGTRWGCHPLSAVWPSTLISC